MPELPEVETVRRGLAPAMEGREFAKVEQRRADLRFPLPTNFSSRLLGATLQAIGRRGKYLVAQLSTDETLIMHLGMSGRFTINGADTTSYVHDHDGLSRHDHIIFTMSGRDAPTIIYNDPRRFGFMDLVASAEIDHCRHFAGMGPEPLGNQFNDTDFAERLKNRKTPVKSALLDQKIVAGIGNIYACEALYRAQISPRRGAASVAGKRSARLRRALVDVLNEAIAAGGSTLKDFSNTDGDLGYFQHRFRVYDREGDECTICGKAIERITQAGRSTFFCSSCQR